MARDKSNIGYLMYLADSAGYLAYVGVLMVTKFLLTERSQQELTHSRQYLDVFLAISLVASLVSVVLLIVSIVYFHFRIPPASAELGEQS